MRTEGNQGYPAGHFFTLGNISQSFGAIFSARNGCRSFPGRVFGPGISRCFNFEDGLRLVAARANAMQKACELQPSTMAAILGLDDFTVEDICHRVSDVVVPANYNCPGQLVISGSIAGIDKACELLLAAGAKRALKLNVGGAFHSPLMESARVELAAAIEATEINAPVCPIYQNIDAKPLYRPGAD
jgi:[acyl-carrier-protein] S-malonyltransferase